jgi:trans-aconitate methyltransferase
MPTPFEAATCSAPAERAARMRDIVVAQAPRGVPLRILDIGCGTGTLALSLAEALPDASITGIDISPANIRVAVAQRPGAPAAGRVAFVCADYLEFATPAVEMIVTDTVLHFIRAQPFELWTRLARDLRPGGVLVCSMAYDCWHNRVLGAARRALRAARSGPIDAALVGLGRMAYGRAMSDSLIRERIEYMYIPPEQFISSAIDAQAASLGLRLVERQEMPGTSATQLKQRVSVFRKEAHVQG